MKKKILRTILVLIFGFVKILYGQNSFVCGQSGVFKTTNGGVTWSGTSYVPTSLKGVSFIDVNTGFVCGQSDVYKTTNGGVSWSGTSYVPGTLTGISLINSNLSIINNTIVEKTLFYPNPTKSQLNLQLDSTLIGTLYSIYDNTGKFILSEKINAENTIIEFGNLSVGVYLLSVGDNLKQTFKIVKE